MERIIKLIEDKMASDECTIFVQKNQIAELERKLKKAEETITEQAHVIDDLTRKEVIR